MTAQRKNTWWQLGCRGGIWCARGLGAVVCWTLWLGLSLLLVLQLYILFAQEMPVPGFLLRSLEQRLAASGLQVEFGRTTFDPTGQVLIENVSLTIPSFGEPVADARLVFVQLDPWALLGGRFEPSLLRASGINFHVSAMLSESGSSDALLSQGDLTIIPRANALIVPQFTTKLPGATINAHGEIDLTNLPRSSPDASPFAQLFVQHYREICRRVTALKPQFDGLRDGRVELVLQPTPKLGAIARVAVSGSSYQSAGEKPFRIGSFHAETRLPLLFNEPYFARIDATAQSIHFAETMAAEQLRATLRLRIHPGKVEFKPRRAEFELGRLVTQGITARHLSADANLIHWPQVDFHTVTEIGTEAVTLHGTVNASTRATDLHATGRFDPELMNVVNQHAGHNIRQYLDFRTPPEFDLRIHAGPDGHPWEIEGEVAAREVYAYHVVFDRIGGHVRVADGRFIGTNAYAAIGSNFATGSYTHDFAHHDFRFLLNGQLRPLDIAGWFHDWWPQFWHRFDFTKAAPAASVDVQGRWQHGDQTSVFVFADAPDPKINGTPLDHVTTLIYLRPIYYDVMQVLVRQDAGVANGWFVRHHHPDSHELRRMDFNFTSTLNPTIAAQLVDEEVAAIVAPFNFSSPVELRAAGHVGEPSADGLARSIAVQGQTQGDFSFHSFPLTGLNFSATVRDDDILIEPLRVGITGGMSSGRMRIQGTDDARTLGFDFNLKQANLQQATHTLSDYFARRSNKPATDASTYIQKNANVILNLDVSAEGKLDDPLSYSGSGNLELKGRGLGEIRLLGLLSELLNFTSLRFNHLNTHFTIERDKVVFPEVSITGSNSAVSARGTYHLNRSDLDFNARIYPFQESDFILKSMIGAILTPLSNVLEVKLTGQLAKPKWAFVIGPTNLIRNLAQPEINPSNGPMPTPPQSPPQPNSIEPPPPQG